MKADRPTVRLTVPTINGNRLTPLQTVYLNRVLAHHGHPITDLLNYACLECSSIGESESQEARDHNAKHIDFTCCDPATTVLFATGNV